MLNVIKDMSKGLQIYEIIFLLNAPPLQKLSMLSHNLTIFKTQNKPRNELY